MNDAATTPFVRIGGEPAVRRLVTRFYELMDTLPEAYGIRKLHQPDLSSAEEKLFMFLCGWLGGPQLYVEKYGHPQTARAPPAVCHRQRRSRAVDAVHAPWPWPK
jgi:hemoglobin